MTVKIQLKQLRTDRKLSQNKLAQLMGMSLQNIQRIEYGDAKSIPLDTLDKLCEILNCEPGDLLIRIPDGETDTPRSGKSQKIPSIKLDTTAGENNPSHQPQSRKVRLRTVPKLPDSA